MSNAEELMHSLRKAKANLVAAKEQNENLNSKYEESRENLAIAQKTYRDALDAIELAAK